MTAIIASIAGLVGLGLLVFVCDAVRRVDQPKAARPAAPPRPPDTPHDYYEKLIGSV